MYFPRTLPVLTLAFLANAQREINSTFTGTCMNNSALTASEEFHVSIFDNRTISFILNGTSTYRGNDTLGFDILESSRKIYQRTVDPCSLAGSLGLRFCPADSGAVDVSANWTLPDIALFEDLFTYSNLDAEFRFRLINSATAEQVGCLKATLSNGVESESYGSHGMRNTSQPEGANDTANSSPPSNTSDSSSDDEGGSNASTAYLNWTLLMHVMLCSNDQVS